MMHSGSQKCTFVALGLVVIVLILSVGSASALMPPEVYAKASRESKIKAIATIVDVRIVLVGKRYTSKEASFKLEYALESGVPETFTGACKSVDTEEQRANVMVGGNTYFYPQVGSRVFVTIREDGGSITSMTPMTSELEQVVREEPERLEYGVTQVYIQKNDANEVEPLLRGKVSSASPSSDMQGQLMVALGEDDVVGVTRLLNSGAGANFGLNEQGMTPILAAESKAMAQFLVERGADPKATDADGGTAYHYAVTRKKALELIPFFAARGVDPNLRGWENDPPLFVALEYFHESEAFTTEPVLTGEPPHEAVVKGPSPRDVLAALIDAGADINIDDSHGSTALMNATILNNVDMVTLLLALGADPSIKDKDGDTAKNLAEEMGHRHLYKILD